MAKINKIFSNCGIKQIGNSVAMGTPWAYDGSTSLTANYIEGRVNSTPTNRKNKKNYSAISYIGIQNTGKCEMGNFSRDNVLRDGFIATGRLCSDPTVVEQAGHWDLHVYALVRAVEVVIGDIFRNQLFELPETVYRNSIEKFGFKGKKESLYFSVEERVTRGTA